ncbi:MAG: exo-alpha-sialidase [Lutibacter sp.]|nr:exo-alpha-sialidase [Lutibacter sp.]MBP9601720.1 exo-alpha-sialidase [Lutibacter sp.]
MFCFHCFLACISCKTIQQQQEVENTTDLSQFNTVFKQGDTEYACFRIPAIVVANNGTILAFAEARKSSCSDTGDIDIVMKKSTNNGNSWSKLIVLFNDENNVCGNPVPIVDKETGTIHLVTT